jgi:hypothetical protein
MITAGLRVGVGSCGYGASAGGGHVLCAMQSGSKTAVKVPETCFCGSEIVTGVLPLRVWRAVPLPTGDRARLAFA